MLPAWLSTEASPVWTRALVCLRPGSIAACPVPGRLDDWLRQSLRRNTRDNRPAWRTRTRPRRQAWRQTSASTLLPHTCAPSRPGTSCLHHAFTIRPSRRERQSWPQGINHHRGHRANANINGALVDHKRRRMRHCGVRRAQKEEDSRHFGLKVTEVLAETRRGRAEF